MPRPSPCALAQNVTYDDLVGWRIEGSAVLNQTTESNGRQFQGRLTQQHAITPLAGQRLRDRLRVAYDNGSGKANARDFSGESTLGRPSPFRDGMRVWLFENNTLTSLRTLGEGGGKVTVRVSRTESGFSCDYRFDYARENGKGQLEAKSTAGPSPEARIVSAKLISKSCRVVKE